MPIVNEDGEYLGMFSEKCCMRVLASLVELIDASKRDPPKASDVMVPRQKLFTLDPGEDVFVAISSLLAKGFSGAPVIASDGEFLGIFSERTCLGFVIEAAYSEIPSAKVAGFIDPDSNRLIDADTDLHAIARIFVETSYARLPVVREAIGSSGRFRGVTYLAIPKYSPVSCDTALTSRKPNASHVFRQQTHSWQPTGCCLITACQPLPT